MTGTEGRRPLDHEHEEHPEDPKAAAYAALLRLAGRLHDLERDARRLAEDVHARSPAPEPER